MTATSDRQGGAPRRASAPGPIDAYQSSWGLDVRLTGDLVRSGDILPGDPTDDCPVFEHDATGEQDQGRTLPDPDADFGEGRRGFGRYRMAANFIRVKIHGSDKKPALGRMTNASVTGLFVRCQAPLPFRTEVRVDWSLTNDMKMSFSGKVVRTTQHGMAIHLTTEDANWRFRASFIDLCRTPTDRPPMVTVRKLTPLEAKRYREDDDVVRRLGHKWRQVEQNLIDDSAHQAFIQTCLKERRLQFALERYRELQTWPTDGFDPTPYLQQIGTILSFYQLTTANSSVESSSLRKYLPLVAVTFLILLLLLGVPYLIGNQVTPPE